MAETAFKVHPYGHTTMGYKEDILKFGERYNDVDLDSFLMRPVIRNPYSWDQPDWQNWVYGSFLSIKNVSPYLTIQPYFIGRHAWGDPTNWASAAKVPPWASSWSKLPCSTIRPSSNNTIRPASAAACRS